DDDTRRAAIFSSVLATKAAGIIVRGNFSEAVKITLKVSLQTRDGVQLTTDDRRRLESSVAQAIAGYVNGLKAGEDVSRNALVALSLADPRLRSVSLDSLTTRRASLPDDTTTRLRDAAGGLTTLTSFDHVSIGQLE